MKMVRGRNVTATARSVACGKEGAGMNAHKSGVWIAMAAILVQAPRLVLAVLAADHQSIGAAWERGLLIVAGIGTAAGLTGGNLYLPHALCSAPRRRGRLG